MSEIAWFGALCDDDYEYLGVPDPALASSWPHCRDIVQTADRLGFDNVLLPSGYTLGIDSTAFAAAIATHTERIKLLLAVRMGEMWLPQLARQLATIDQMAGGRLNINIISSEMPGEELASAPRYQRTRELMAGLRTLLNGERLDADGEFVRLHVDPPRARTVVRHVPADVLRRVLRRRQGRRCGGSGRVPHLAGHGCLGRHHGRGDA